MTRLELLAPARNMDIGIAAIRCGADAVYIGGPAFGARAAACNSVGDIRQLCDFAAPYGVRIYVTINTLARDNNERDQVVQTMLSLKGIGVKAFIMQDTSLLESLSKYGPWQEEFHASTQCAIRTPQRARQLADMGFSRLILERELSLAQIRAIRQAVPECELEFFVHGALCVCYSGDCYLSEKLTGRSANRGECSQPCRSLYDLVDGEGGRICSNRPLLSLKDFKLIDRLEDLAEEGIVSFKIEGRLKNESYVKNVVRAYDMALNNLVAKYPDRYSRASLGRTSGGFTPNLDKTFNRGYTSLFIDARRSADWNSGDAAKGMGEYIGTVARTSAELSSMFGGQSKKGKSQQSGSSYRYFFIELDTRATIANGDGLCFVGRGGEVIGLRADKVEGHRVYCKPVPGISKGVKLWRNLDTAFEKQLEANMPQRLIDMPVMLHFHKDSLIAESDGITLSQPYPQDCPLADNQERIRSLIQSQISKTTGPYRFNLQSVEADGPLPLLPAAFFNALRRSLSEALVGDAVQKDRDRKPSARTGAGIPDIEKAGAGHPRRKGELMRSKYCIRHQLGMCLKETGDKQRKDLFLVNNNTRIPLRFDCSGCEMVLQED